MFDRDLITEEVLDVVAQLLAGVDQSFVDEMAKRAITNHADTMAEMSRERDDLGALPDINDIKNGAADFMKDMLADFSSQLAKKILSTEAKAKVTTSIEIKVTF